MRRSRQGGKTKRLRRLARLARQRSANEAELRLWYALACGEGQLARGLKT